jgi:hypothetical protein
MPGTECLTPPRPIAHADPSDAVRPGTRRLLLGFVVLTLLAVAELLLRADRAEREFAWRVHPEVSAAFLGAAFAAGFVLSVLSLRSREWSRIRVALRTIAVFSVLTLLATLVHAHHLQLLQGSATERFAAWLWLAAYVVVPVACLAVIGAQQAAEVPAAAVRRPMPRGLARLLGAQGVVLMAAGTALFLGGLTTGHQPLPVTGFWPWDLTPLGAMVTGSWLLAFGVATVLVIRERDLARLLVPAVAYTVFGVLELVVLLADRAQLDPADPSLWACVGVLFAVAGTGGYGWWAAWNAQRAHGPVHLAQA